MSHQFAALSSGSNSIPLADQTISCFTSGLPRRLRHLQSGTPHTLMYPCSSPPLVEPLEFHSVDPATIPHVDNDPDWVNASIPAPTPVFQTSPLSQLCHGPVVTYCMVYHYTKRVTLARLLANEGPAIYIVHLNRYFVIPP